ncbi:MAG: glycoside hydrolase family 88 protein [Pseudonocardia sp.]
MSRLRRLAAFAAALALALAGCGTAAEAPARPAVAASAPLLDAALTERAMAHAAQRLADAADRLDPQDGYPRSTGPDGRWQLRDADIWTSGFFAGSLWLMYERTGDPVWRQRAQRWTAGLEAQKARTDTHDLGFMIFDSFGWQHQLTGDPHARDVTVEAARSLATRFNPAVGAIKSWDVEPDDPEHPDWRFPVIIDNLMNLELLFWAAGQPGGDPGWAELATRHALTSMRVHLRPDGSTAHVALFDPVTGAFERQETWQGQSATSTWSRGQAWAIHGFTDAHRLSGRPELLDAAQRAADWYLARLPTDRVPYWDFEAPDIPYAPRDASAAAIAASGLVELGRLTGGERGAGYRRAAEDILASLTSGYLTVGTPNEAVLAHSVGFLRKSSEVDVGLVYADYYFLEAISRLHRR